MNNIIIKIFHNFLRWGFPDGIKEKDTNGFQPTYNCKYCKNEIVKDSQGNWFHLNNL